MTGQSRLPLSPCEACGHQGAIEWAAAVERMRVAREFRHISDEDSLLYVLGAEAKP